MNEIAIETRENGRVFIQMSVYKDILTHASRFANILSDYNEQVLGFCVGNKEPDTDNINVIKAIPITHGDQVELGFSEKIHNALEQVKKEVKERDLTIVGWYHSHPNSDSFFFSDVDKKNHLYFQTEQNPLAFGIVFDHTKLKKADQLGLEVFQLKNYKLNEKSGIIRVKYEVEPPKSLDFFNWVRELVEYSQTKNPNIIPEKLETIEGIPGDLQEIPMSIGQDDIKTHIKYPNIDPVIDGFKKGLQNLSNLVLNNYKSELELWSTEFNDGALIGIIRLNNALSEMNSAINIGFENVEKWIDIKFKERLDEYKEKVERYVSKRIEGQEELKSNTQEISKILKSGISEYLDHFISDVSISVKNNLNESINKLYELSKLDTTTREKIENSAVQISNLTNQIEKLSIEVLKGISAINHPFEINITTNLDNFISELENFQNDFVELEKLIDRLQKIIPDFRNIKK
jgi:proteasome lid subunit RPN8/RPN11